MQVLRFQRLGLIAVFQQPTRLIASIRGTAASSAGVHHQDSSSSNETYSAAENYYTPSPYKKFRGEAGKRYGYKAKFYTGGPLPLLDTDKPLPLPTKRRKDPFIPEKAYFGQNDFADILGDGSMRPSDLMDGPAWLRGFRGNELERLIRRLRFEYDHLADEEPAELAAIQKRIRFLYRRFNRYRRDDYTNSANMFVQKAS